MKKLQVMALIEIKRLGQEACETCQELAKYRKEPLSPGDRNAIKTKCMRILETQYQWINAIENSLIGDKND